MIAAARHGRLFRIEPKAAIRSSSQVGSVDNRSGRVAQEALAILRREARDFEYEGERHADAALDPELRERLFPGGRLTGRANVLIHANSDAAGAARNLLKSGTNGLEAGPIASPPASRWGPLNTAALAGAPVSS